MCSNLNFEPHGNCLSWITGLVVAGLVFKRPRDFKIHPRLDNRTALDGFRRDCYVAGEAYLALVDGDPFLYRGKVKYFRRRKLRFVNSESWILPDREGNRAVSPDSGGVNMHPGRKTDLCHYRDSASGAALSIVAQVSREGQVPRLRFDPLPAGDSEFPGENRIAGKSLAVVLLEVFPLNLAACIDNIDAGERNTVP